MKNEEIKKRSRIPIQTKYSRIRDHMDYFLFQALENVYYPLTMLEIKEKLKTVTDVNLSISTIAKDLDKYHKKYGESLLCKIGDRYRLNHCLYKYVKTKLPRGYADGNQI